MSAITPPTPENVAASLANNGGKYDHANPWFMLVEVAGHVVQIRVRSFGEKDSEQTTTEFRAVVVEGDRAPIVLERPATLAQDWLEGGRPSFRSWISPDGTIRAEIDDNTEMTPADARREAARMAALADQAEAQTGGEA
ncbi:hypothetical protein [Sphaerisporangium sp. TRM90804]|uniref:hypothetical protein n=1 Tax=Sphaerisporangium sp. TRM90804 TaxID=3031113 RepID=UPI0024484C91|nr:hypothetical protein [Sphaerisporangium sp. TRM90804]MDH2424830.1 hypothetical protein [Sphaerisporangium sp. TRM90804]